ncbi:MAG: phenylacetate--CoA ligase family protein [Planctomycetaceae bacterium]|nr:phenylacetate--CoA ligase family protein [Planctomycetaceae bacterium]
MTRTPFPERRRLESLSADELDQYQLAKLNALLEQILPHNRFYADKLADIPRPLTSLAQLAELPFTFKRELIESADGGDFAANRTWPVERYVRYHQTSGTRGRPVVVLDTHDDWEWWLDCWQYVLDSADVSADDRCVMAFSFGPFIGFWSAYEAAERRGCLMIPAGGMTSVSRLELIRSLKATVVFCTPSYALHLAEVAAQRKIEVGEFGVRRLILAGEPGASVPATRERIQSAWQAECIDHAGATEVGAWGFADRDRRGLQVIESEFICEFLSVDTGQPAGEGELSELVITSLGRVGSPVIRYRTGDLVRPYWQHDLDCRFVLLEGGVVGRADDMVIIRGVNVFPSAIEQIVRSFPEVLEYRVTAYRQAEMDQLRVEIEDRLEQPERVAEEVHLRLGLKVEVLMVPLGSLPRYEGKGLRFVDQREQ